jgi:hypothetical protein
MKSGKATGPGGVPIELLKMVQKNQLNSLLIFSTSF